MLKERHRGPEFHLLCRNRKLRLSPPRTLACSYSRLHLNLASRPGALYDHLGKAVEQRTLWFLIALLTIRIAIAHADDFSRAGDGELDHIVRIGHRSALSIESLNPQHRYIFTIRIDYGTVCRHLD